jgi:integrase
MAKRLTDRKVRNERPSASGRREIADAGKPGLYLVVQSSGKKSWAVRYRRRSDGKPRKYTLDGFPSLGVAHRLAQAVLDKIAAGEDPAAAKVIEKQKNRTADPSDIEALFVEFMRRHVRKRNGQPIRWSTRCETARLLGLKPDQEKEGAWIRTGNGVLKRWRGRTVESIGKGDVLSLLDELAESAPINANRTLAALKTFFSWCIKRDKIAQHPCISVDDPSPEAPRERPLSDLELAALWKVAGADGYPFGHMVQLLMLTGCRRDEVREAPWSELNLPERKWLIPGARTKNGHEHLLPLPDAAIAILKEMPRIAGKANLLFTTSGATPVSGLSRFKRRIDAAMLAELHKANPKAKLPPWRLHDLRHTLKTWMQRSRIAKDVRNAVQNHHDGDMDELYGHYTFEAEKREALEAWARHIQGLGADRANVVPLPKQQRGKL